MIFSQGTQIPFYNDSGSTIDPYSVFRVDGLHAVDGVQMLVAKQSNTYGSQYSHYINGPTSVADESVGACFGMFPCLAAVDGSPSAGDQVGPRSGSWILENDTLGFRVVQTVSSGLAIVERDPMLSFVGKYTDSSVNQGDADDVAIYFGQGMTPTDTGITMSNVLAVSQDFTDDDFVNVVWMYNQWQAFLRSCGP